METPSSKNQRFPTCAPIVTQARYFINQIVELEGIEPLKEKPEERQEGPEKEPESPLWNGVEEIEPLANREQEYDEDALPGGSDEEAT